MGKSVADAVLDAAWNQVKNNADKMVACSSEPTTYTEANATYAIADVAVASGDFTLANGDTSGRKMTVASKSGVTVDANGTIGHVAIINTSGSALYLVTTTTSKAVTTADTVTFPAHKYEITDPT